MTEKQLPLLTKVIDIKAAKKNNKGQQGFFEQEERFIPYSLVEDGFRNMGEAFTNQQNHLTDKVDRLTNTLENLVPKFEMGVSGKKPDLYIDSLAPGKKADLATIDGSIPTEPAYPYVTSELAPLIGMHPTRLGTLFKRSGISGDESFHYPFKTGKKGHCQRYKMRALDELHRRAKDGEFDGMKPQEIDNLENYLKIREAES